MKVSTPVLCLIANMLFPFVADTKPCCVETLVVGALAFTGGVLVTKHFDKKHHHHGGCHSCSCGGCGGGCGWCGGRFYGRRRRRRSITSLMQQDWVLDAYKMVAEFDKDQCGLKLLCELAQRDPRELTSDEVEILLPYRGSGKSDGTIYGNYDEAVWHGQEGHKCPIRFPLCHLTSGQIMAEYREHHSTSGQIIAQYRELHPGNDTLISLFNIGDATSVV